MRLRPARPDAGAFRRGRVRVFLASVLCALAAACAPTPEALPALPVAAPLPLPPPRADRDVTAPPRYLLVARVGDQLELRERVRFEARKDELLPVSFAVLREVAAYLREHPTLRVRIEAHLARGDDEPKYGRDLSRARADAVRRFLEEHGVEADRLDPVGYGDSVPIQLDHTEAGREANRRIELRITGG